MNRPVFPPNIDQQKLCFGDHGSACQRLVHRLVCVVRVVPEAAMLSWQSGKVKSPLNAQAAAGAEQNRAQRPYQGVDFAAGW